MRVIVNIQSHRVAESAGWRARAIQINSKSEADLEEVLKAVAVGESTLYDLIIENGHLQKNYILYVNGTLMSGSFGLKKNVRDNVQIHIIDKR